MQQIIADICSIPKVNNFKNLVDSQTEVGPDKTASTISKALYEIINL